MNLKTRLQRNIARIKREPGLGRNVAAIVAAVVLAVAAGAWVLGNERFTPPWANKFQLSAEFAATPGISPGNGQEVRIAGVIVGQISKASVGSDGHAQLQMSIDPGYKIYNNAVLVLQPKSLLNEMFVTINPGGPPGTLLKSGAVLPLTNTQSPIQVDEVLSSLNDNARGAITALVQQADVALANSASNLPPGVQATNVFLQRLQPVVSALQTRRASIRQLVTSLGQIFSAVGGDDSRITRLAANLQSTLATVGSQDGALKATLSELPGFVQTLGSSTAAVQGLSAQLQPTLNNLKAASSMLPDTLGKLTGTAHTLQTTISELKPFAAQAQPLFAGLSPVVSGLQASVPSLITTSRQLDPITSLATADLPDLGAFMINTASISALKDGNAGVIRALLVLAPTSLPTNLSAGLASTPAH
ncbi:MAG: Mammalian cell entry related domain protein [Marmoricola sp.]|nr:Mammalian cell entry related domain protein [Marmoricola sp.]